MPQTQSHLAEATRLAVFTVCSDPDMGAIVAQAISRTPDLDFAGDFQDYITGDRRPQFPDSVMHASCSVALIDLDKDRQRGLETVEALQRIPALRVAAVGLSSQVDSLLLLEAMRAGCTEFLPKPVAVSDLTRALERLQARGIMHQGASSGQGQVISVFGAKGGVGATTLAVHIAMYLARAHGKKTLLIDHHHQLGHVSLYLGIKDNHYHFDDLIRDPALLDTDLLKGFVRPHASGLGVLGSPDKLMLSHQSTPEQFQASMIFLRREYEYIVIDSSLRYGEMTTAVFAASNQIYTISTPDIAAIRDLSRSIEQILLDEDIKGRVQVIVNRRSPRDTFGIKEIEAAIHLPVSCSIPNSYKELEQAINSGEPIAPGTRSDFCAAVSSLVSRIVSGSGQGSEQRSRKRRFSLW
jgi:pilus assembly protein CpaE